LVHLEENNLIHLPKEIGGWKHIRFLYIGKNQLDELPDEIGQLTVMVELDVAHSGVLLSIPSTISHLHKLETLYIDRYTALPTNINTVNPRLQIIYR